MAMSKAVPGFTPAVHGLQFTNSWPKVPDVVLDLGRLGRIPIGDASNGLCGGMVYTAMDVFAAGLPPIPDTANPPQGTPLFDYIVSRLFDSFDLPAGVFRYYDWMTTPDQDSWMLFFRRRGVAWDMITQEWPRVRADIDAGRLSALGLVTVRTADPRQLGLNHQVLAYGYDIDDAGVLTLHLYDPNTAQRDGDRVRLSLDLSDPTRTSPITHNVNISRPIRGFFRTAYTFRDPSGVRA